MSDKSPRPSRLLRSTLDRVLVHDIKNMGFRLQLLLSNLEDHYEDPEFKHSVKELLRSTIERIDQIVERYSARDEAVLIKVSIDLNTIVRDVALSETRRGAAAPLSTGRLPGLALALGEIPEVWGDPYYLAGALKTLVDNALEAAPEGRVVIRTYRDDTGKYPRVVVEVIDNGPGMTPEFVRDRLFKPFQTTKPDGVGLGLATASQIIHFHQGKINVLTRRGGGTIVRSSFPAVASPVASTLSDSPSPAAPSSQG